MKATFKQMRKWKLREVTGLWSLFGKWSNKNSMPGSCDSLACAITYAPALLSPHFRELSVSWSRPTGARPWQCTTGWGHLASRGTGHQHGSSSEQAGLPWGPSGVVEGRVSA